MEQVYSAAVEADPEQLRGCSSQREAARCFCVENRFEADRAENFIGK